SLTLPLSATYIHCKLEGFELKSFPSFSSFFQFYDHLFWKSLHEKNSFIMALIDHSPHQPDPVPRLESASNLILIDNYDSFTWNIYQYLVLEGAQVTVYRNDEISLDALIATNPTQLV